jgi:hypothetical protein
MSIASAVAAGVAEAAVRRSHGTLPAVLALLPWICGCGSDNGAADASGAANSGAGGATTASVAFATQQIPKDPCSWISRAHAEDVLGPLTSDPARARSAETPVPDADGRACLYAMPSSTESMPHVVAIQIVPDDRGTIESALELLPTADEPLVQRLKNAERASGDSLALGRWDYVSNGPNFFNARAGRISFEIYAEPIDRPKALELAGRILDSIPELPFEDDYPIEPGPPMAPDPCSLLTRGEAESVLGPLTVHPYRSRESTALVRGDGTSCTYFGRHHRALVITPTLTGGRVMFKMSSGINQTAARSLGNAQTPDTLDGPWDQLGRGMDGTLSLLTGDRILELQYLTSPADLARTLKLARTALPRLVAMEDR